MFFVKVKDENDNVLVFIQFFISFFVFENNFFGIQLIKISVTDVDSGRNVEISYLLGIDVLFEFNLDRRIGILIVVKKLDREKQEKYFFIVLVKDNGILFLTINVIVLVIVFDQNDNSLIFIYNEYNFYVLENFLRYGIVGLIIVIDFDYGENFVVIFFILDVNDDFIIDLQIGVI